jgi:dipeptidyl aminopeptidase/acylaminoacyl peptidase
MPPAAAFATPPRMSNVRLSFDGKSVAWLDLGAAPEQIIAFDLVNGKDRRAFNLPADFKLRDLEWADNDTLIYTASTTLQGRRDTRVKFEFARIFSADLTNGKTQMFLADDMAFQYVTGATLLATHTSKPKTAILYTLGYSRISGWAITVYEVDTLTGRGNKVDQGAQHADQWVVDPDGASMARSEWDQEQGAFSIFAKRGSGWAKIYSRHDGNRLSLDGLTADRKAIVCVGLDKDGRSKLLGIPLDGSEPRVLFEDKGAGVANVILDRLDARPIAVTLDGPEAALTYIDPASLQRLKALTGIFPGATIDILGQSKDSSMVLAETYGPESPPKYFVIDFATHKARLLGEAYPALAGAKLGKVSAITYKARDGTDIPAYLTTPAGAPDGAALPMVVIPHGGPEARDYFTFDYLAQFIASRGYLVLQPQFRGSTGFGEEFRKVGIHEWGGLMQDDVTDGVKAMIDQHLADPQRVCILGWSYGGYAALAGAAFTPELYKCAISINGVFDLPMMIAYEEKLAGERSSTVAYWREHMGSPRDPRLAEKSPSRHAAGITAHVLLIQSADDTVVPAEQSDMMGHCFRQGE